MAAANFEACMAIVLSQEGGFVDHSADPGGATMLGITRETLARYRGRPVSKEEVRALTVTEARTIYREMYWGHVGGDELPVGLDLALFDFAVNSGPQRAIMSLQRALKVADDGKIGPVTLEAMRKANPVKIVAAINADRMRFLRKLKSFRVFGKGWTRRVNTIQASAARMLQARAAPPPTPAPRWSLWALLSSFISPKE